MDASVLSVFFRLNASSSATSTFFSVKSSSWSLCTISILFAEDNELNWEIGKSMLSELGMELDRAENGKI